MSAENETPQCSDSKMDFLTKILPSTGKYCAAKLLPNGGFVHAFFDDLIALKHYLVSEDTASHTMYLAQGNFFTALNRKQTNVKSMKTFFLDIDCGPEKFEKSPQTSYPTQRDGALALAEFCKATEIPFPALVNSGNGLYAHWIMSEDVPAEQWKVVANVLKKLYVHHKFRVDPPRTADTASVLRPVGTHNRKYGVKPVTLLKDAEAMLFAEFSQMVTSAAQAVDIQTSTLSIPSHYKGINDEFTSGVEGPPCSLEKVAEKCAQIRKIRDTKGNVTEPHWYNFIGLGRFSQEAKEGDNAIIHEWSCGHPDYSQEETDRKIKNHVLSGVGPTTCVKFSADEPYLCVDCPHSSKIKTPLVLGRPTPLSETNDLAPTTATVARLSKLHPLEYDKVRKDEANALGVRPSTLDAAVKAARKGNNSDELPFEEVDPWPDAIDPSRLLYDVAATVRRFIVCEPQTANTVALWGALTWFIDVAQVAPLAIITAPEKRCGKSQLLFLLSRLSARAMTASSISPSALFRTIDAWCPTLLIDECDALLKDNEELRGLLNSGHTRDSAYVIRCVGESFTPTKFSTWGAKALAGIGHVADTLMDRAVILELRRKLPHEQVDRIRYAEHGLFDCLRSKLARFAEDYSDQVRQARPPLPHSLNDRAQDNWEPLLAIAMTASDEWLQIGTAAALKLSGCENISQTVGTELLSDIQEIFESKGIDRISTFELIQALCADDEKPWATYNRGMQIKPRQIATKLKSYGIQSKTIRIGSGFTPKGYDLNQFKDVFARYLSAVATATTPQSSIDEGLRVAE